MNETEVENVVRDESPESTTTDYDIPWRSYSESERLHILNVLRRDVELRRIELERIR